MDIRANRRAWLRGLAAAALCTALAAVAAPKAGGKGYEYYLTGNAADALPAVAPQHATAVLMGGGTDVDAAFAWMIAKAGGGDFVVLRASGADGYNDYVYAMGGLDSVETLVVKTREAAADPFVLDRVNKAEAIFIAGGDQKDYVTWWKGTPLEAAINARMAANVPIGGTSAGLAVLGAFDFSALNGTVDSATALTNPYDRRVALDRGFLTAAGLANTITDSHFVERDRMGRLVTFLARIVKDGWATANDARAIGIDSTAALLVEDGMATLVGGGAAYFLRPTGDPAVCLPRKPLTFRNVEVIKLLPNSAFRLDTWSGGLPASYPAVEAGVFFPPY